MNNFRLVASFAVRILISALFLLSATLKLIDADESIFAVLPFAKSCSISVGIISFVIAFELFVAFSLWVSGMVVVSLSATGLLMALFIVFHIISIEGSSCGCMGNLYLSRAVMMCICISVMVMSIIGILVYEKRSRWWRK